MAEPVIDLTKAAVRGAIRRAAAVILDTLIGAARVANPDFDLSPAQREIAIDIIIRDGTMQIADLVSLAFVPPLFRPRGVPETRPNVLWTWEGVEKGLKVFAQELIAQLGGDPFAEEFGPIETTVTNLLLGRSRNGRKYVDLWKYWWRYCLPQWSKGRKDQPNNRRLQRRPPRNASGKPHKSPLGTDW